MQKRNLHRAIFQSGPCLRLSISRLPRGSSYGEKLLDLDVLVEPIECVWEKVCWDDRV